MDIIEVLSEEDCWEKLEDKEDYPDAINVLTRYAMFLLPNELHQEKLLFAHPKRKVQNSCAVKSKASSHLLLLYSLICVGPGQKPWTGFLVTRLIYTYANVWQTQVRYGCAGGAKETQ